MSKVSERLGLSRPVDDLAHHPSGELAVDDLQLVGRHEVHHQLVCERFDHLPETTGDDAAMEAEPTQSPNGGPGSRRQLELIGHVVEHLGGQSRQSRHSLVQRLGEVQFTAHGGLGDLRHRRLRADSGGQHLDDLALDQRRVDVEHDEPLGPSRQAVVLQRDVDALFDRDPRHRRLQLAVGRPRWHGDAQLQPGDGIVRDAADEVDVDSERGNLPGHDAERLRRDGPPQHHDRVGGRLSQDGQVVAALDGDIEPDGLDGLQHVVPQLVSTGHVGRTDDQDAQGQPTPDHDLFDVEQFDLVTRQHFEQCRCHAWLIDSGDGDQHRHP